MTAGLNQFIRQHSIKGQNSKNVMSSGCRAVRYASGRCSERKEIKKGREVT